VIFECRVTRICEAVLGQLRKSSNQIIPLVLRGHGCEDSARLTERNGDCRLTDATGAAVDQNRFTTAQVSSLDQGVVSSGLNHWHGRRVRHAPEYEQIETFKQTN